MFLYLNTECNSLFFLTIFQQTLIKDSDWPTGRSGVDYYFINDNGETFKTTLLFSPYFFIGCKVI